jgi:hypothetical protein
MSVAVAAVIAVTMLLGLTGCTGSAPSERTPLEIRLVDIQSRTLRVNLHQVVHLDTGTGAGRYTAQIADERVVSVVQRRDQTDGRLEPELVPLRVGSTQVALTSSIPGDPVVGFKVVITP